MKRIITLILFLLPLCVLAQDSTPFVQNCINTPGCLLPTATYNVTSLTVTRTFDFNHSTINAINSNGQIVNMNTAFCTIMNGIFNGTGGTYNPTGLSGVTLNAVGTQVQSCTLSNFSNYGIVGGAFSNQVVNNCTITNTGNVGIDLINNAGSVSGISVTNNIIDRSAQGVSVVQACLLVRAQGTGTMTGSVVTGNNFKMPSSPTSSAGECFEMRNNTNGYVNNNIYTGGTIGFSMVGCTNTRSPSGTYSGQSLEGIEIVNSNSSSGGGTFSSGKVGILVDGNTTMSNDTITNSTMSGLTSYPILFNINVPFVNFQVNNVTATTVTQAVYVHYASNITINNSVFTGNNTTYAILFDTSPGNMNLNNCIFNGFLPKIMNTYSPTPITVNNIIGTGISPTPTSFLSVQAGTNVTLGSNIHFNSVSAPNITYASPQTYTVGVPITPLSPTNTGGAVTGWSVLPGLPSGLTLTSGTISGTPLSVTPTATYNITASNSSGSSTFPLVITVNAAKPRISYIPSSQTYVQNSPIATWAPTNTGGGSVNWSVTPTLPVGLSFNTVNGQITGTPTVVQGVTNYKVKATNTGGVDSTTIQITVNIALPVISYSPYSSTFTVGTGIMPLVPTNTGGVSTNWTITPTLPSGLSINASTGTISGTPTVSSTSTIYTITATNASGFGRTQIALQVNNVAPNISYTPSSQTFTQFVNIVPISPTNTGGAATSFTISQPLPSGLIFNTATGTISGTPLLASPSTNYTVTAFNISGSSPTVINITVTGNTVNIIRVKGRTGVIVFPP